MALINDTFLVTTESSHFVLQRINRTFFPAPNQIMDNLITLNRHLEQKPRIGIKLKIPAILKTTLIMIFIRMKREITGAHSTLLEITNAWRQSVV